MTVISGAELEGLIGHLQAKWRSINEAYGRLPCVLDTPSTRRRKEVGRIRKQLGCLGTSLLFLCGVPLRSA